MIVCENSSAPGRGCVYKRESSALGRMVVEPEFERSSFNRC